MRKFTIALIILILVVVVFSFAACEDDAIFNLVSVSIVEGSFEGTYYVNSVADYSNAKLLLSYSDGSTHIIDIEEDMVSGFSTQSEGVRTLIVTYDGRNTTHVYNVIPVINLVTVSSVEAIGFKTEYLRYEAININGAILRVNYSNGDSDDITVLAAMVTSFDTRTLTTNNPRTMTITANTRHGTATTTVNYTVIAPPTMDTFIVLTSIDKLIFQKGDTLATLTARLTVLSYKVEYSDGTINTIAYSASAMTVSGYTTDVVGARNLTLRYTDSLGRYKNLTIAYEVIEPIQEYEVTYNYQGAGSTVKVSTTLGKAPVRPTPTRTGYAFRGWFSEQYYNININQPWNYDTIVNQDMTLFAWWTPIEYTITYIGAPQGSQNVIQYPTYDINRAITLYQETKTGYIFEGYNDGTSTITSISLGTTGNLTLTAVWTPINYAISYNYDQGTPPVSGNPANYNIEDSFVFGEPTRTGYTFEGWKNNANDTIIDGITAGRTGALSLTAQWQLITYTITYVLAEDEILSTAAIKVYNITSPTLNLHNPTKNLYTFGGWFRNAALTQEQYKEGQTYKVVGGSHGNIVLYPLFIRNYQIGFVSADVNTIIFAENVQTVNLPLPTCEGYIFDGWKTSCGKIFSAGVTDTVELRSYIASGTYLSLTAQWTPIVYNITYKKADGTDYGQPIDTYTVAATKNLWVSPDADFRGWARNIGEQDAALIWNQLPTSIFGDLILYAIFN